MNAWWCSLEYIYGKQRGMVYINVIKVSLIPRRELNCVVETEKGERPCGELVEISRHWCYVARVVYLALRCARP